MRQFIKISFVSMLLSVFFAVEFMKSTMAPSWDYYSSTDMDSEMLIQSAKLAQKYSFYGVGVKATSILKNNKEGYLPLTKFEGIQ